jgi:hypothetical protein
LKPLILKGGRTSELESPIPIFGKTCDTSVRFKDEVIDYDLYTVKSKGYNKPNILRTDFCGKMVIRGESESETVSKASSEKFGSFDSISNENTYAVDQNKDKKTNSIKHDRKCSSY